MSLLLSSRTPRNVWQQAQDAFAHFGRTGDTGLLSSGSEGDPKLILISKKALEVSAHQVNAWTLSTKKDVFLRALPRHHMGGFALEFRAKLLGAAFHVLEDWSAATFLEMVRARSASVVSLVPTQVFDLLALGPAPKSLRVVFVGGDRLDSDLYLRAKALGYPILPTFGMTECASQVASAPLVSAYRSEALDEFLPVLPHVRVRIDAENRLCIRSEALCRGWVDLRARKFIDLGPEFETQDAALLRNVGGSMAIKPLGRMSLQRKVLGELVSLQKIESEFARHLPFDLCVISFDHARRGTEVALVVAATPRQVEEQFEALTQIQESLSGPERALSLFVVDTIPRGELGKVQRKVIEGLVKSKSPLLLDAASSLVKRS